MTTLRQDLEALKAIHQRWAQDDALRHSRHNAMFHLGKVIYRLRDYLKEVDKRQG